MITIFGLRRDPGAHGASSICLLMGGEWLLPSPLPIAWGVTMEASLVSLAGVMVEPMCSGLVVFHFSGHAEQGG